ncbi:hypothetical protein Gasu2_65780 [Galdieria sulphuraria]|nr:hypothetical protein Gasu2_65780 [Galdieria sulphuraria]
MDILQGAKFVDWLPPFLPIFFRDLTDEDFCRLDGTAVVDLRLESLVNVIIAFITQRQLLVVEKKPGEEPSQLFLHWRR